MKLKLKKHNEAGVLITFCGLDGCGKTTLIKLLEEVLINEGFDIVLTKQPTDDVRKSEIFRTYMDRENHDKFDYRALSLLAASDRVQHSNKFIKPILQDGGVVISDRYFYSCLANLRARGYTSDKWIYDIAKEIPTPDIAFFLDVEVETAIGRVRQREAEKNKWIDIPLQYRLREEYINICRDIGGILLDSSGSDVDQVFKEVYSNVVKYMKNNKDKNNCIEKVAAYG